LLISFSVIIGLVAGTFGIGWADTVIALVIVVLIIRTAFVILARTTNVLVDAAAVDPIEVRRIVENIPGVDNIVRVRSRGPADTILTDIDVQVQPATTADRASAIANEISERVKEAFSGVQEVQVRFAPHHNAPKDYRLMARATADALGLSVHEVTQMVTSEGLVLEMHVEVQPTLSLAAAHKQVSELERRLTEQIPEISDVLTHIEPASEQAGAVMQTVKATVQRDQAMGIAEQLYPEAHWHDATIRLALGGYAMTLHCWLPGNMSVQEAHEIAESVQIQIRAALPQIQRVTIHTEPPEDAEESIKKDPSSHAL
jgi:divalent metal cation (Fe/Co/Zn/Cd) transporter